MQVCISIQTDDHAITHHSVFTGRMQWRRNYGDIVPPSSGLVLPVPPSQRCGLCQNFKQTTLTTRLYKVRTNLYPPHLRKRFDAPGRMPFLPPNQQRQSTLRLVFERYLSSCWCQHYSHTYCHTYYYWYSITHSLFHSWLKSYLFCKSALPQPFLFLLQDSLYGFPRLFTVTSVHIRLFTF